MWGLITTIVGYFMLAEMGISNSVMRHLMECKDGKDPLRYGRIFTGSALIMGLIAIVIVILGTASSQFVASLFPVPPELVTSFRNVMIAQSLLLGINMGSQVLGIPLYVHHRQDISQISQMILFIIYYVVLHMAFKAGWGIYSMLANQAAGMIWGLVFHYVICSRLNFYPKQGTWHLPTHEEWTSIWRYSRDVFAVQIGGMILSSIPQLMIARLLGLEASATWSVATRPFAILRQIVGRPFDVALPMIYDSYIHGNMKIVTTRWQEVTQVVLSISAAAYAVAAANNATFLHLWTSGRIHWEPSNHWMLACYFYVITMAGLAFGAIGIDKSIGKSRFVGFIQAILTLAMIYPMTRWLGISGLIIALTAPYIPGMTLFGVRYLGGITGFPFIPLAWHGIIRPTIAAPLAATAVWGCSKITPWLPGYAGLMLSAFTGTLLAVGVMLYLGVSSNVRLQMLSFAKKIIQKIFPACSIFHVKSGTANH